MAWGTAADIAQLVAVLVAIGALTASIWKSSTESRRYREALVRDGQDRRRAELTDLYERVLEMCGEMLSTVVLVTEAGYVNRRQGARLLSQINFVSALLRLRLADRAVIAEVQRFSDMVLNYQVKWGRVLLARLGMARGTVDDALLDQLLAIADSARDSIEKEIA